MNNQSFQLFLPSDISDLVRFKQFLQCYLYLSLYS